MGIEFGDGALADQREDVGAQSAHYGFCVAFGPATGHVGVPLQSNGFEKQCRPLGYDLGLLLFFHWVEVVEQQRLGFIALTSCDGKGNDGVIADDERTFLAVGLGVLQAPGLHAIGFDEKVHAATVEQFVGALAGFGRAALQVAERDR
ncbi:hypothetical protein D9M70_554550 [compost metagenome]